MNKYIIDIESLKSMTQKQRYFFVSLGLVLDDIKSLRNYLYKSKEKGIDTTSIIFYLSGKLYEANKVFKQNAKEYKEIIDKETFNIVKSIRKRIDKNELFEIIRNQCAFHYPDKIYEALDEIIYKKQKLPKNEIIISNTGEYISEFQPNVLILSLFAYKQEILSGKRITAFINDVLDISKEVEDVINKILINITENYFAKVSNKT